MGFSNLNSDSPCTLLPTENVDVRVANVTIAQCNKAYEDPFLSKLESMCVQETSVFGRVKRELITIGIVIVALIARAGIRFWDLNGFNELLVTRSFL